MRVGWIVAAPRSLNDDGELDNKHAKAWCYELAGRNVRGDGKRVEARQHRRRRSRARRPHAVRLEFGGIAPAAYPGDMCHRPEAMCASTFCRSGDSTTVTANLQCDTAIEQQLAAVVKSITVIHFLQTTVEVTNNECVQLPAPPRRSYHKNYLQLCWNGNRGYNKRSDTYPFPFLR